MSPRKPGNHGVAGGQCRWELRIGTTTLFAAMDVASGKVISSCLPKHRHNEFLMFLKTLEKELPDGLVAHLIVDNAATH